MRDVNVLGAIIVSFLVGVGRGVGLLYWLVMMH